MGYLLKTVVNYNIKLRNVNIPPHLRVRACEVIKGKRKITEVVSHLRACVCVRVRVGYYLTCVCVCMRACVRAWGRLCFRKGTDPQLQPMFPGGTTGGIAGILPN